MGCELPIPALGGSCHDDQKAACRSMLPRPAMHRSSSTYLCVLVLSLLVLFSLVLCVKIKLIKPFVVFAKRIGDGIEIKPYLV
jgi:hypothetical protein